MTHLEREIRSQPAVLERVLRLEAKKVARVAASIRKARPRFLFLVARGSSDNAGLYGKYLLGSRNRLVVALATPSLFTLYRRPPDLTGGWVVAISQSGASDDLRKVVAEGRRQGVPTLVITNTPRSPLVREADDVLLLHAGKEHAVAATKTYTAEMLLLGMLSVALGGTRRDREALLRVPETMQGVLAGEGRIEVAAERHRTMQRLSVIGRGYNYATAFELSLKLKELAYLAAEPSSSADFRHGPIAVVDKGFPVLLIAPRGRTLQDMRELARALMKRDADLLVISDSRELLSLAATAMPIRPGLPEWLTPLTAVVPGQLFAMHLAARRGCSLDAPRGLHKITRTS